jgi:pyruvate dehydrogenase E1 component beta subunit
MAETRFGAAINKALADAMEADSTVVLLGEDIAIPGGPFGVTRGLMQRFGGQRVRDTPISEAAIAGMAVGAALTGMRPVVEIMFMDFMTFAMDAIVNQAAKAHFMFGGQCSVPMVVRTPHGGGLNAGPQHSQCLEAWFAHVPGLKVVVPSNPADAYGLLRSAIADPNPVIFVENKTLYSSKGLLDADAVAIPLGSARVCRVGSDVTLVSYGATVNSCIAAADFLAAESCSVEVIDLRCIQPWDQALVTASVRKTGRLVIAHEAVMPFGVGAEIAATISEQAFGQMRSPPFRVGAAFMPVPFGRSLELGYLPGKEEIVEALQRSMNWKKSA